MNEKDVLQGNSKILDNAIVNSPKNLIIAYLDLNSLRNKINDLRILIENIPSDYFVLTETKLDNSFSAAQFHILKYEIGARRNQNNYGGGLSMFKKVSSAKEFKNLNLFVQN